MGRPMLQYGSYGPDVRTVQECLECSPLDSDFGSITEDAVIKFQRQQDLTADGIVGTNTWNALEEEFDLPDLSAADVPDAHGSPNRFHL